PFNNFDETCYQKKGTYCREFRTPEIPQNSLVFLEFEGVSVSCSVWLNGRLAGKHKGPYTPFHVEITDYLASGTGASNRLFVEVDGSEDPSVPPFGGVVDYLAYAGIYRAVWISVRDECHIQWIHARPAVQVAQAGEPELAAGRPAASSAPVLFAEGRLSVEVKTSQAADADQHRGGAAHLKAVLSRAGKPVAEVVAAMEGDGLTTIEFPSLPGIELWDTERPALYDLEIRLEAAVSSATFGMATAAPGIVGASPDTVSTRIGFREARFTPQGFFLNGRRLFLRGLNRHQSWPYAGYAMGPGPQRKDAEILRRDLGVRIVRTSHYPQSPHFLDACDELGLLVFTELPGWQHIGDADWKGQALCDLEDLILRDRNHPSIVLWGVRINESPDDADFYRRTNEMAHRLDPDRQTGGVRAIRNSQLLEDVYTYNDFTHDGGPVAITDPKAVTGRRAPVPYMITEHDGHMFPTKRWDQEERLAEQARRHARVVNAAMGKKQISGAIGWCAFDYNTHKDFGSGDRICYHGVCDMFRLPKYAAFFYSSQKEPSEGIVLEAASLFSKGERDAAVMLPIDVWTNCDAVDLWRREQRIGRFYPDRRAFPNLGHPPVHIDDLIGEQLDAERFSPGDARTFRVLAAKVMAGGMESLSPGDKLRVGLFMARNRLSLGDLERLVKKYGYAWGNCDDSLGLVGILGGKEVLRRTYGADAHAARLVAVPDDTVIRLVAGDEWNAARVVVRLVDQYGNTCPFAFEPIRIRVEGAGRLLGPAMASLQAGSIAFWVASVNRPGAIDLRISSFHYGEIGVQLRVEEEI
ncbi:MAG: hypothetical protein LLF89_02845, partial [Spirochaetaceae bacterium]|nr:hypothetical protein [Spirochaetaceae bacterium]